jgi:RNA polymerase sigma-70 factor (ECF subfamily)
VKGVQFACREQKPCCWKRLDLPASGEAATHSGFLDKKLLRTSRKTRLMSSINAAQQVEDQKLIRLSQAGDTKAFDRLVGKYHAKVLTSLYSMVRNENDAWDLAQEGFLKAWRSIHQFEGRSSFHTWLYRIMVNLTIVSLNRRDRREEVELDAFIPSSLPSPRANYQYTEIRQHFCAALAQLSPQHRAVIELKELEDLQYRQIARILNVSIGTVMSRIYYGRKKLKSILRPFYGEIYQTQRQSLSS